MLATKVAEFTYANSSTVLSVGLHGAGHLAVRVTFSVTTEATKLFGSINLCVGHGLDPLNFALVQE